MLSQAQVEQFQRDGFLLGPHVFSDAEVEVLRADLDRVAAAGPRPWSEQHELPLITNLTGEPGKMVLQIIDIFKASNAFNALAHSGTITEEIAQLTGASELRIWHDQIQWKPAATGGVNMWHQDAPLWPSIKPMTMVTAWVALDDVDEGNGCMSMVPGSHLWGDAIQFLWTIKDFDSLPESYEGHPISVRLCPVKKGQVHYHHSLTWHGSNANQSERARRAIAVHYMTQETHYIGPKGHPLEPWITLEEGEKMHGPHFPLVWSAAKVTA